MCVDMSLSTLSLTPGRYDKPHIAKVDFYKHFVFGQRHTNLLTGQCSLVKNFIEDSFGQVVRIDIRMNGLSAHAKYGSYLFLDRPDEIIILHANGRYHDYYNPELYETV